MSTPARTPQVTVTVRSVKERELPEPDDEFAQLASEFDTIDELRDQPARPGEQVKRVQQAEQIRDTALEALLEQVDVPLPEAIVQAQVDNTLHNALAWPRPRRSQVRRGARGAGLVARGVRGRDPHRTPRRPSRRQLLLDALADDLDIQVGQDDLTERLVLTSRQYGIEPQQLFAYLQENNQLPAMFADVRRGLTIAAVVEAATVTDTDGNTIDTSEFFGRAPPEAGTMGRPTEAEEVGEEGEEAEAEAEDAGEAAASSDEPSARLEVTL